MLKLQYVRNDTRLIIPIKKQAKSGHSIIMKIIIAPMICILIFTKQQQLSLNCNCLYILCFDELNIS